MSWLGKTLNSTERSDATTRFVAAIFARVLTAIHRGQSLFREERSENTRSRSLDDCRSHLRRRYFAILYGLDRARSPTTSVFRSRRRQPHSRQRGCVDRAGPGLRHRGTGRARGHNRDKWPMQALLARNVTRVFREHRHPCSESRGTPSNKEHVLNSTVIPNRDLFRACMEVERLFTRRGDATRSGGTPVTFRSLPTYRWQAFRGRPCLLSDRSGPSS
jgi:hypothetical protein